METKRIRDLKAIVKYIATDNPQAAKDLRNEIVLKIAKLIDNPKLYKSGRQPGTRELIARKNYIVVYAVTSEEIIVLRVIHSAQNYS